MLSTEIVKIINEMREDGAKVLTHDNFLKKVVAVLGAEVAVNFNAYYKASNGKSNPCYALPKRESHLMVMSENTKVQAAVYDRMVALELRLETAKTTKESPRPEVDNIALAKVFEGAILIAKLLGYEGNRALLSANSD